tara:strand:+ start:1629 stop:2372 length:744 start_codon:yes stop_codon:yes gene_type:complete
MAEQKKGFVLYADIIKTVSKLTDEKAGELFKHLLLYVNDENPQTEDLLIEIAFEPIKQQLKRDLEKWEKIRIKRSEAGQKSAEARKSKGTKSTSVESVEQTATNPTVSVNDNVNVTVNVNDKVIKDNKEKTATAEISKKEQYEFLFNEFWKLYDKKQSRDNCLKKWSKLTEKEIETIFEHVPQYITAQPDKQYRKNPLTYLNQKSFNDEIINSSETGKTNSGVSTKYSEAYKQDQQRTNSNVDFTHL